MPAESRVILLHGLWMRGFAMTLLRHRLQEDGYAVESFDYMSVVAPLDDTLRRLRGRLRASPAKVHLVGHSLGGLLALLACADDENLPPGRIVCLGSPLRGSAAAQGLTEHGGAWLLGHSRALLERGMEGWTGAREVGMIAGRMPLGLGAVLGHFDGEHDGTVAVAETRIPGLADHCVVEASHTGLLFSADAAAAAVHFLHHGRFGE
jgi:pimeloyl-ACP methyl ester carboxylesterase